MAADKVTAQTAHEGTPGLNVWLMPVIAAWVVPGGGYFFLKKTGRGVLVFGSVALMFLFGMFMRGTMFTPEKGDALTTIINYGGFLCDMATGVLYFASAVFGYSQADAAGAVHDYGTKFLVTAGLLNILAISDVFDIATGKKD